VGTANFVQPGAGEQIVDDLQAYCEENGVAAIGNLVGRLEI